MSVLFLDCFAGISGNMVLGALLDAGVPEDALRSAINELSLDDYAIDIQRVDKQGISAVHVDVHLHIHHHDEQHHSHRHLPDIIEIIEKSGLSQTVKDNSKKVFTLLATMEARVHGTTVEHIHFHEVGAVDAIIDIVGAVFCLEYLGVKELYVSQLQTGTGFVACSHGLMPIPAPATAELLLGIPHYSGKIERELVTPTGAAIIAALGTEFGNKPAGFIAEKIGYGAGTYDLDIPNVLRAHLGYISGCGCVDTMVVVEANIDDINPQLYPFVMDKVLSSGATDVWLTPVLMKKGRPGHIISVLVNNQNKELIEEILLTETTTIGVRYYPVSRTIADRENVSVATPWGAISVKISRLGGKISNITPEFEECRAVAERFCIPLKDVQTAVRNIICSRVVDN